MDYGLTCMNMGKGKTKGYGTCGIEMDKFRWSLCTNMEK